ncbi:MAG: hypothetical protein JSV23_04310 [Promethearchaeota archaeon]|nr:MAG: hypothetical protein JSV23_04310 [Candidatus Lokiarchaeota archaeon]
MTQAFEKSAFELEIEESEQQATQKSNENKDDKLLGDLNPRYFEIIMTLNEAKQKIYASGINAIKMNFFRPFYV